MRLTDKGRCSLNIDEDISGEYCPNSSLSDCIEKLGQLEDIEDELGVDLIKFLRECKYVLEHSNMTEGKTSKGTVIETDFGYVEEFIEGVEKALAKEELE